MMAEPRIPQSPPPQAVTRPIPSGSQNSLFQAEDYRYPGNRPAGFPAGVPRKKLPDPPSDDAPRLSRAPTSPVHVNYPSEYLPQQASSAQVFDPSSAASSVAHSPLLQSGPEFSGQNPGWGLEEPLPRPGAPAPPQQYAAQRNEITRPPRTSSALYAGGRNSQSPVYDHFGGNGYRSRHSSTGSIEEGLRAARLASQRQYEHRHSSGDHAAYGARNRDSAEGIPSARSESPASSLVGDNPPTSRRLLAPLGHSNTRPSFSPSSSTYSSSHAQDRSRGRVPSPMNNYGPPFAQARPHSLQSRQSPDSRPASYVDLLNIPYYQPPQTGATSLDNSHLRNVIGSNASLLSHKQTLEMYRANAKKTNDPSILYEFAVFMTNTAKEVGMAGSGAEKSDPKRRINPRPSRDLESPYVDNSNPATNSAELIREARQILQRLSDRSYPFAQYYLADGYSSGLFSKGKEDYDRAFPLFLAASKHGHAESGYRAALCYEFGWGCRKDPAKAEQFYRQSASKNHPGAMVRLGQACLHDDLGLGKRYREGVKWLKRAAESADHHFNWAPYELGLLHETGYGEDVFQDEAYAAQLFTASAELGHAEANYRLGDAYEHGKLQCPRDPALSVHFYNGAAQKGHPGAMMALCAWYMVGAEPVLDKDENEAYEWARKAADSGLAKAEYAVGYFTEMGIGCRRDPLEANVWYVKAADQGDERAKQRLATIRAAASNDPSGVMSEKVKTKQKDDKDCILM